MSGMMMSPTIHLEFGTAGAFLALLLILNAEEYSQRTLALCNGRFVVCWRIQPPFKFVTPQVSAL